MTILPTANTGLVASDTFYYGNAVAEAGEGNPAAALAAQEITDDYMRGIIAEISDKVEVMVEW